MGICPRCGSWVDEGEPYCCECSYVFESSQSGFRESSIGSDIITVNGYDYCRSDVEDALDEMGYDFDDLEIGIVDEDELEEILNDF